MFDELLSKYDYSFPKELIAQKPAHPRDSAKLLVYNREKDSISFDTFANITCYLPKNVVLVFNQTKVIPARLFVQKTTGGIVELLYLGNDEKSLFALANAKLPIGEILTVYSSEKLSNNPTEKTQVRVIGQKGSEFVLEPLFPIEKIFSVLEQYGNTPIPPYIKHSPLSEKMLRKEYQSVFAKEKGSVAAPTASLHFTKALLEKIKAHGCDIQFVTLHVGLGTFAKVTEANIKEKRLHKEFFTISEQTAAFLTKAKKEGKPIIAVGTTVVRTLESASTSGQLEKLQGTTELFIQENYQFSFIDGLITNFHVPKSSLLMLVSALVGREKLLYLYKKAIKRKFRLFSFGDGMLII